MDIIASLLTRLRETLSNRYDFPSSRLEKLSLEQPKNPDHGCLSTNAAMILTKDLKRSPRVLAAEIADTLLSWNEVSKVAVAGPGFVNLNMTDAFWHAILHTVLKEQNNYGKQPPHNKKINIEYVSANPTGPLHVAHARGAVIGDVIANLFSWSGFDVTREYYVNDAGSQIKRFAHSAFLRYQEALGHSITIPDNHYPGDYLIKVGQQLAQTYNHDLMDIPYEEALKKVKDFALHAMITLIKNDLSDLGIHQDFVFESDVTKASFEDILNTLRKKNLVYEGSLEAPKGLLDPSWTPQKLTLFASTHFGDDVDRPLYKTDNTPTYFGNDLLYHAHKLSRNYHSLINVLGADHGGYVKRIQAAVNALSNEKVDYPIIICQIVRLTKSGKPFVMSKRSGSFIRLSDLTNITGPDAIRFFMLMRKPDAHMDFDLDLVTQQTTDNPVFYVQYAHARCCSVLRHAQNTYGQNILSPENLQNQDLSSLSHQAERIILQRIALLPHTISKSSQLIEPHKIAFYARDLASDFHSLWNLGHKEHQLRFINTENHTHSLARIALVHAVKQTLANSLAILGIKPLNSL